MLRLYQGRMDDPEAQCDNEGSLGEADTLERGQMVQYSFSKHTSA